MSGRLTQRQASRSAVPGAMATLVTWDPIDSWWRRARSRLPSTSMDRWKVGRSSCSTDSPTMCTPTMRSQPRSPHAALGVRPYLRGFGPTRFLAPAAVRSGQQAVIGSDAAELIEALEVTAPIVGGFDWGGRAACIAAALWPERVGGLVAIGGYEVQDLAGFAEPEPPLQESRAWYQHLLPQRARPSRVGSVPA